MKGILQILVCFFCVMASAQNIKDSVKINFQLGKTNLNMNLGENRKVLENIKEKLQLNAEIVSIIVCIKYWW